MKADLLSVREMIEDDIDLITQYFLTADSTFLKNMGVDIKKVPQKKNGERYFQNNYIIHTHKRNLTALFGSLTINLLGIQT